MKPVLLIFTLLVGLALAQPAWAQGNGNGNGNGNSENAGGADNSNAGGNGNSNAGGNGNGNAGGDNQGNGNQGNGNTGAGAPANSGGNGNGPPDTVGPNRTVPATGADERAALEAAQSGRAVSLDSLLPDVRATTGGTVIDAQLVTVDTFLLYALKVLTPDGRLSTRYYYARTGQPVRGQ